MVLREGDYLKDIVDYINNNLDSGYKVDELRFMLMKKGYSRSAIEKGFKIAQQERTAAKPLVKPAPKVVVVESKEEPVVEKKPGLLSKITKLFSKDEKSGRKLSYESDENIQVDASGILIV